jgi:tRNA 2-thiocytidine biosynthesis protein TtcA
LNKFADFPEFNSLLEARGVEKASKYSLSNQILQGREAGMRTRGLEAKVLRLMNQANRDFNMITEGDRIMVALSGGKDSYGLMWGLTQMRARAPFRFDLVAFHLDQGQPGYDGSPMRRHMEKLEAEFGIPWEIETQETYTRVVDITEAGKSYCSLCSRFRRAILYKAATRHGCNKVALGHHRDDLIETLMLNLFFAGSIKAMPPRLLNDAGTHEVMRPLAYVPESHMEELSIAHGFEIMPCTLCGSQESQRKEVKKLLAELSVKNPHLKGNLLNALRNVQPSQLADSDLHPFYGEVNGPDDLKPMAEVDLHPQDADEAACAPASPSVHSSPLLSIL